MTSKVCGGKVVDDDVVHQDLHALRFERREESRIDIRRHDQCRIARLASEPPRDRARARTHVEAPRTGPHAGGTDRVGAQPVDHRFEQLEPLLFTGPVLGQDVFVVHYSFEWSQLATRVWCTLMPTRLFSIISTAGSMSSV